MQVQIEARLSIRRSFLNVDERLLLKDEQVVPLTPKAFDALVVLVEISGALP